MTKFIKLTERYNDKEIDIVLNCDCIVSFKKGNGGMDTMIQMRNIGSDTKNKYYFVKQTVDEVWGLINSEPKFTVDVDNGEMKEVK